MVEYRITEETAKLPRNINSQCSDPDSLNPHPKHGYGSHLVDLLANNYSLLEGGETVHQW
jgi:hypothetical protein